MTSYILFEEGESPIGMGQNLALLKASSLLDREITDRDVKGCNGGEEKEVEISSAHG